MKNNTNRLLAFQMETHKDTLLCNLCRFYEKQLELTRPQYEEGIFLYHRLPGRLLCKTTEFSLPILLANDKYCKEYVSQIHNFFTQTSKFSDQGLRFSDIAFRLNILISGVSHIGRFL